MAYVVTENCIRCRYTDCVEVCPVDCFHALSNMLIINPEVCIDCGVCEPECPAGAIVPEDQATLQMRQINQEYSKDAPIITVKEPALADADLHLNEQDKYNKYFNENIKTK